MKLYEKRRHNVAVVPLWLVQTLAEHDLPMKTALNFDELAAILSKVDVCLYYHYLCKLNTYTDDVFNDMENIIHAGHNFKWLNDNADQLKKTSSTFTISFDKCVTDLSESSVPMTIRKTPYRPMAVGDDTLLLIATNGDMGYSRINFYSDCMAELTKQMPHGSSVQFEVFKRYTLT